MPFSVLNLRAAASFNSMMASTLVYFEALPLSMHLIAARLMLSGVSKSGSPAPRPITLRPAAFNARALSVTAMVAEGLMRLRLSARKAIVISACPYAGRACPKGRHEGRQDANDDGSINTI